MTDNQKLGLRKVRRALISVSDKTGIVELANALKQFDVEILSTGGTARALRDAGIEVRDVSEVTGFPEMMDGRVKTLHPKIHGGLLAIRDNPTHQAAMVEQGIEAIDLVVINLYPFEQTVAREGVTLEEAIEQIDIGGPAMIRSAAKNFRDVAVVTSSHVYDDIAKEMSEHEGALTGATRQKLSAFAYTATCMYDATIYNYLSDLAFGDEARQPLVSEKWPAAVSLFMDKDSDLRYGENPHQKAALYSISEARGSRQCRAPLRQRNVFQQLC